jgi:hypothetical protein
MVFHVARARREKGKIFFFNFAAAENFFSRVFFGVRFKKQQQNVI